MNNQKKKRNHWVPKSYLKAFTSDERQTKIWRLGKDGSEPEQKPIDNVAVEFYLYAPNGAEGRDYTFEDRLSELEQLFGNPIWKAACTDFVDLEWQPFRKGVALLAAVMFLRNPLRLKKFQETYRGITSFIGGLPEIPHSIELNDQEFKLDHSSWPEDRDATDEDIKRMWINQISEATFIAEIFLEMRWSVLVSEQPIFITTDNPVVPVHESLEFRGFKNKDTRVIFPLSPTRILFMDHRHTEPSGQYYPISDNGGGLNGLLWGYSIQHMFSARHPGLVCSDIVERSQEMGFG